MTRLEAVTLGSIQGLTEFLPISSSAHLYVVPTLLGWRYAGLAFDVTLHWGTLVALLAAFWREWLDLLKGAIGGDGPRRAEARDALAKLTIASVPTALAGVLIQDVAEPWLRSLPLQASTLMGFGLLLWWADRARPAGRDERVPGWGTCLLVGAAQTLALVPGVSRSGVTMTAGRLAGLTRVSSARFSFLLATPITLGAGILELARLPRELPADVLLAGLISSAVVGLLAIRGLIGWLGRAGFGPFVVYRSALAVFIFARWLTG